MKLAVTKREKIMLFSVGLIVLIYLAVQFAIIPLSSRYSAAVSERGRLSDEKAAHDLEAAMIPSLRERNSEAYARFDELTSGYPTIVENEELDHMLTSLSNRNQLRPVSLRITPRPTPAPPPAQENGEENQTPDLPEFTKMTVQMNVIGSYRSLLRLFDEVSSIQYIRITNVSFSEDRLIPEASRISATYEITFLTD